MALSLFRRAAFSVIQRKSLNILPIANECTSAPFKMQLDPRLDSMTFKLQGNPYKYHKMGDVTIADSFVVTREEALKYYYHMQVIRKMEKLSSDLYKEKVIRGFCHLYSGQEACGVGFNDVLHPDDSVITAYR